MVTAGSSAQRTQTITYSHQMQYATVNHDRRKLGLAANAEVIDAVYGAIVGDALAGRYRHARGLVTSRAAYAFAVRGDVDRANTLWRQSILVSCEDGFYGDVRNAMRASRLLTSDSGVLEFPGLDVVTSALPNQRRLLSGSHDPALSALDAAHRDKLPDAFGDARRYLWESRLAGHLLEEMLALSLFGDVVAAGGRQAAAIICYVMAGQAKKAAELAAGLSERVDVTAWSSSALRRRRAAAIQVIGAQAAFVHDDHVTAVIEALLLASQEVWTSRFFEPHPELDALKAVASFGVRIPDAAVNSILAVAAPTLGRNTRVSDVIAGLLIQTYWAVESRRGDVAAALASMLRLPDPPYNLWDFLPQIPAVARELLLPTVTGLADNGNAVAVGVLASWRQPSATVQLAARSACAALLRRPTGVEQVTIHVGTQEFATVNLLLALLDADDLTEVPASELTAEKAQPAGGVFFSASFVVGEASKPMERPAVEEEDAVTPATPSAEAVHGPAGMADDPDEAAITAAGPPEALAIAVARKLTSMAGDVHQGGGPRANALFALRQLLPSLPQSVLPELIPEILRIIREPLLSAADQFEIDTDTGLSRARFRSGARDLVGLALVVAAEAFAAGRDATVPADDADRATADEIVALAAELLRDSAEKSQNPVLGALSVVAVARAAPDFALYATGLIFHGNEQVRGLGAGCVSGSPNLFRAMASDPSPNVRAAVAARARELPNEVRDHLAGDIHLAVRWGIANTIK